MRSSIGWLLAAISCFLLPASSTAQSTDGFHEIQVFPVVVDSTSFAQRFSFRASSFDGSPAVLSPRYYPAQGTSQATAIDCPSFEVPFGGKMFDSLRARHPELVFRTDPAERAAHGIGEEAYAYFLPMIEPDTRAQLSDDYAFCRRVRDAGLRIWLAPWVKTTHSGPAGNAGGRKRPRALPARDRSDQRPDAVGRLCLLSPHARCGLSHLARPLGEDHTQRAGDLYRVASRSGSASCHKISFFDGVVHALPPPHAR